MPWCETDNAVVILTSSAVLSALRALCQNLASQDDPSDIYRAIVDAAMDAFPCDAVVLLRWTNHALYPVALRGLTRDARGRIFRIEQHPRLARIVTSPHTVIFADDDRAPDPYDQLIGDGQMVHSCMGCRLQLGNELVGVLTFDHAEPGRFDQLRREDVDEFVASVAGLIGLVETTSEQEADVSRTLAGRLWGSSSPASELLGESEAMTQIRREISLAASTSMCVLVTGETGTGKELVVRAIQSQSDRAHGPFVYVNCAALPASIAESELFGHERGAFTGATNVRAGRFEQAHGGTLFLDEIAETSPVLQAKLLRAVQFGECQRVGAGAKR